MSTRSRFLFWLKRHQVLAFFLIAFGITWTGWFSLVVLQAGILPFRLQPDSLAANILFRLAGYGPAVSAIVLTALVSGKEGLRDFFGRCVRWRVKPQWYAAALFTIPATILVAVAIYALLGGTLSGNPYLTSWYAPLLWFLPAVLITAGLAGIPEEPGWRGYALPRLLDRYHPLLASIVLGLLWGLWHMPIYIIDGDSFVGFLLVLIQAPALSILMTWVYVHAKRSTLLSILFHAATDAPWVLFMTGITGNELNMIFAGVLWAAVLVVVAIFGPHLSRKHLHRSYSREVSRV